MPAQNLEMVLAPVWDEAHNDLVIPSPWLFEALREAPRSAEGGGGGETVGEGGVKAGGGTAACPTAASPSPEGRPAVCALTSCDGPMEGFRGPLWRFYPPHRVALMASQPPLKGRLRVRLAGACTGPPLEDLPLELAWDRKAAADLRAEVAPEAWAGRRGGSERAAAATGGGAASAFPPKCKGCEWELLIDEQGPPTRLLSALRHGHLIFKQASPYVDCVTAGLDLSTSGSDSGCIPSPAIPCFSSPLAHPEVAVICALGPRPPARSQPRSRERSP